MNGYLIVNKDKDFTSRDVVNIVSKSLQTKKVGHTGTLDPLATGVLVILVGRYTKLEQFFSSSYKEYIATIKIGIKTDTLDITGKVLEEKKCVIPSDYSEIINSFTGTYLQEVPLYSAVHVNGRRLYDYARNNETVLLPKKNVEIKAIQILDKTEDSIKIKCLVSKGTYIRSLIRDICDKLGVIGTMADLERTKQGDFLVEDALSIIDIKNNNIKLKKLKDLNTLKYMELDGDTYLKVKNGSKIFELFSEDRALLLYNDEEIAIYENESGVCKPYVML